MTAALGAAFGAGLLLLLSPWLWPRGSRGDALVRRRRHGGRVADRLAAAGVPASPQLLAAGSVLAGGVAGGLAVGGTGMGAVGALA
ncbi:MAG: hypothetical protein JWP66_292, partial [Naasia sp.]|nr:hypothetical protein [Naasia sp.]